MISPVNNDSRRQRVPIFVRAYAKLLRDAPKPREGIPANLKLHTDQISERGWPGFARRKGYI